MRTLTQRGSFGQAIGAYGIAPIGIRLYGMSFERCHRCDKAHTGTVCDAHGCLPSPWTSCRCPSLGFSRVLCCSLTEQPSLLLHVKPCVTAQGRADEDFSCSHLGTSSVPKKRTLSDRTAIYQAWVVCPVNDFANSTRPDTAHPLDCMRPGSHWPGAVPSYRHRALSLPGGRT